MLVWQTNSLEFDKMESYQIYKWNHLPANNDMCKHTLVSVTGETAYNTYFVEDGVDSYYEMYIIDIHRTIEAHENMMYEFKLGTERCIKMLEDKL